MELRFHLDPETDEPHIHQRGVTEDEVEALLRRPGDDFHQPEPERPVLRVVK
jgi:hypothetical protein